MAQQRRISYASTTDTETESFRTPVETPGQLSGTPSHLDLGDEGTPRKSTDNASNKSATGTIKASKSREALATEDTSESPIVTRQENERPVTAVYTESKAVDQQDAVSSDAARLEKTEKEFPSLVDKKHNVEEDRSHGNVSTESTATGTFDALSEKKLETSSAPTTSGRNSSQSSDKKFPSDIEKVKHEVVVVPGDPTGLTTGDVVAGELKAEEAEEEDNMVYPGGLKLALITFGLALATFVVALDNTIIATAIPQITTIFNSLNDVGWYGSSYLLCTTSLQPTFGKIYSFFNVKYTYLVALAIFEAGSIICATATGSVMLIVGRAIAGAGAAGIFSGGMTIIGFSVPLQRRPIFIALLSSMFGISSIVGPLIGGVFTDAPNLTWRWCFWINLPFGGFALATVFIFFKNPKRKHVDLTFMQKLGEMDLPGAFILIGAIVCLLLGLQWGGTTYAWNDSKVWGCLLGFGLLLIVFIIIQIYRGEKATIPLRIMKQRTVCAGCIFSALLAMGLYASIYFLPFYFQSVQGTSAEQSGIRTIPYLVSNTLAAIVIGIVITKTGYYVPFLWIGSAIFTAGSGVLYLLKVDSTTAQWIGYQLLAGIGAGCCVQIPFISVQVVLSSKDMPTGNALTIFFNTLGGAFSVSIAQNIFSNKLQEGLSAGLPPDLAQNVLLAGATHVRDVTPPQFLETVLQAYNTAITQAFILPIAVAALAFLTSLAFEWRKIKGNPLTAAGGA